MDVDLKDVNYLKFSVTDKNGHNHDVKACIIQISKLVIRAQAQANKQIIIDRPQKIDLNLICSNGLYTTTTNLNSISNNYGYTDFVLDLPKEFVYKQERDYFRVKIEKDAILSFKQDDEIKHYPVKIKDLSASGVKIDLKIVIDIPDSVAINMLLDTKEVRTNAKFIRIETEHNTVSAAFKFMDLSDSNKDFISKTCIQKQLQDKRKGLN